MAGVNISEPARYCPSLALCVNVYLQALEKDSSTVVFAGARKPAASKTLGELKVKYGDRLQLITLDVIDEASAKVILLPNLHCLPQQSVYGQSE